MLSLYLAHNFKLLRNFSYKFYSRRLRSMYYHDEEKGEGFASTPPIILGPQPTRIVCPYCHEEVITNIVKENTRRAHKCALLLCIFCFFIPFLCCIPYCVDSYKSKSHYCPNCNNFLGKVDN